MRVAPDQVAPLLAECRGGSMKGNPVVLEDAVRERVLPGRIEP